MISGPYGRERIHFEAPAANRVEKEMAAFIDWFNNENSIDLILKAGIAHLWFVTIHPFDDGNGRIARALTDVSQVLVLLLLKGIPVKVVSERLGHSTVAMTQDTMLTCCRRCRRRWLRCLTGCSPEKSKLPIKEYAIL